MAIPLRRTRLWHAERAEQIRVALRGMSGRSTLAPLKSRQRLIAKAHDAIAAGKPLPKIEPGKNGFDVVSAPHWAARLSGYADSAVG